MDDPFNPNLRRAGLPDLLSPPNRDPSDVWNGLRSRLASRSPGGVPRPTGPTETRACPCCGEQLHAVPITHYDGRTTIYIWNLCQAKAAEWTASDARVAHEDAVRRAEKTQAEAERALGDPGLGRIARFSLDTFNPDRLLVRLGDPNPFDLVAGWLDQVRELPSGDYHRGPAVALHLYYPGKGTGKTHLAAGAALRARGWGQLSVFIEETSFLERSWSVPFAEKEKLSRLPGELAWLTVIDDLGQNPPGRDPTATQRAWYNVINQRWLKAGWTIITSNKTLDQMADQGTLSEAAHSRLYQMTRGEVVLLEADDQRLRSAP